MRRIRGCWVVAAMLAAAVGLGQSAQDYLKLRKQLGITQAVGVEALETLVGKRTLEVRGVVKGSITSGDLTCLMLERSDGEFLNVFTRKNLDWLEGNAVPVRLLVSATRSSESAEVEANLLGAAPEESVARYERSVTRSTTVSRSGMKRSTATPKNWNLPASDAVPVYAGFIQKVNKRLNAAQATSIAQGVIGFSLKYGVDARLIMAMVMTESGFNPNATSRAGAMGLGQLMPGTARGMGVSNAYDTMQNLYGTVRLIRGHLDKYTARSSGDFEGLILALAAYNAGSGAVRKHGGVPPYRETQNYVRKVTSLYRALSGA